MKGIYADCFSKFRVREHYRKVIWSVKILEKAIFRWLLKIRGFRGLEVQRYPAPRDKYRESDVEEEDLFQASRKQVEARLERAILRVHAMFHSKKVQEDYRRFVR